MTRQQEIQRLINEAYRIGGNTYGGAASAYDGGIDAFNELVRERDALVGQRYDMRNNRYVRTGAATPSANAIARAARIVENPQTARDTTTVQQPRQQPSPAVRDSVTVRDSVATVDSTATRRESAIDLALRLGTGEGTGQRGPTGRNSRSLRRTAEATVAPQRPAATQTQQPAAPAQDSVATRAEQPSQDYYRRGRSGPQRGWAGEQARDRAESAAPDPRDPRYPRNRSGGLTLQGRKMYERDLDIYRGIPPAGFFEYFLGEGPDGLFMTEDRWNARNNWRQIQRNRVNQDEEDQQRRERQRTAHRTRIEAAIYAKDRNSANDLDFISHTVEDPQSGRSHSDGEYFYLPADRARSSGITASYIQGVLGESYSVEAKPITSTDGRRMIKFILRPTTD